MNTIKTFLFIICIFIALDSIGQNDRIEIKYKVISNYLNDLITNQQINKNDTLLILNSLEVDSIVKNQNNFKIILNTCEFLRNKKQPYFALGYSIYEIEGDSIRIRVSINQVFNANKKRKGNGCTMTTKDGSKYGNLQKDYLIKFDCTNNDWIIKN
jgi:hypothetical protein